jgi:hypothetical protein
MESYHLIESRQVAVYENQRSESDVSNQTDIVKAATSHFRIGVGGEPWSRLDQQQSPP